jgi:hypothetical protein
MKIVDGGPAAVRFTFTWPPEIRTVNGWNARPDTSTVPENVSLVTVAVGDGAVVETLDESLPPVQAAATRPADARDMSRTSTRIMEDAFLTPAVRVVRRRA